MELTEFTKAISIAFESQESITAQTDFRNHDEWCSIVALSVMAVVRKKYKVTLKAEDLRLCETVEELYELVKKCQQ